MRYYDSSYWTGIVVAWMLRLGLFIGLLAILALAGCSPLGGVSLPTFGKAVPPELLSGGNRETTAGTRNDIPPNNGGCHEKSDSAPYKALERSPAP